MKMVDMLARSGCSKEIVFNISKEIVANCMVCQKSRSPQPSEKLSLSHYCETSNQELQTGSMYVEIWEAKCCVLHDVDTGTAFFETSIANKQSAGCMAILLKSIWIHRHGAPVSLSTDAEFTKASIRKFLSTHHVELRERPIRRRNKTVIVEHKHHTVKTIMQHLQKDIMYS